MNDQRLLPSSLPLFARISFGICTLILALVILIFAARALGIAQPPSTALATLHLSDCSLPCWLGITPGQTNIADAIERLSVVYPHSIPAITDGRIVNADTPFGQVIVMADSTGLVHRISLPTFNLKGVSLADAASQLGTPSWVVGAHPVAAYYGCRNFLAVVSGTSVDGGWRQRLVVIDIQDVGYSCPGINP